MKYMIVIYSLLFGHELCLAGINDNEEIPLNNAVLDFNHFQQELSSIFDNPKRECQISELPSIGIGPSKCTLINYCKKYIEQLDSPYILDNMDHEVVLNALYFNEQKILSQCLKDKYSGEITAAVEDYSKIRKNKKLKEVYDLNQKLKSSLKKKNELATYTLINQELLSMRLETQMSGEEDINNLENNLAIAEKKLKIKLSQESKKLIIRLDKKMDDDSFQEESIKFENSFFKTVTPKKLFADMDNFTDPLVAGSAKNLVINQNKYNLKVNAIYEIFSEAKNTMLQYLNSKKNSKNTVEIERAIERVKLVKFKIPVLADDFKKACEFPNAKYMSETNSISMCPGMFELPKISLFETFAHEIGHSIDPCNLSAPFKIKSTKAEIIEKGPFEVSLKLEPLFQSKVLVGDLSKGGMPLSKNPFSKSINCLGTSESIEAKNISKDEFKKNIEMQILELKRLGRDRASDVQYSYLKAAKDNLNQYFDQYGMCHLNMKNGLSQIEESFADKVASEIVAIKISKLPKVEAEKELEKMLIADLNTEDALCPRGEKMSLLRKKGIELGCSNYFENKILNEKIATGLEISTTYNQDSHPPLTKRVDKIILAHPVIRSILGCSQKGVKYCED